LAARKQARRARRLVSTLHDGGHALKPLVSLMRLHQTRHAMATIHPDAVAHHRKRWLRHDAYRFAPPGSPEADPGLLHPWAAVARAEEAKADAERAEQDAFEREVLALRADTERVRRMLAEVKYELAWRRIVRKYSPDQPRVPAGNADGGQWTSGGASGAGRDSGETARTDLANVIRICIAGSSSITTDRWGNQKYWVDYVCADGFTFRNYGLGGRFQAFFPDPRF
jgi:hypothetical protein